jgi:hypothetical protein
VVIKVFFAVLVLCTAAVVAVILAVHFRVKRHLQEQTAATPDSETVSPVGSADSTDSAAKERPKPETAGEASSTSSP